MLVCAPAACAGTYTVTACDRAPGDQNNSWQPFNEDIAHLATGSGAARRRKAKGSGRRRPACSPPTASPAPATPRRARARAGSFTAPPGTSIVALQADRYLGAYGDDGWVPSLTAGGTTLESCTFSYPADESCIVGEPFGNVNSLGPRPRGRRRQRPSPARSPAPARRLPAGRDHPPRLGRALRRDRHTERDHRTHLHERRTGSCGDPDGQRLSQGHRNGLLRRDRPHRDLPGDALTRRAAQSQAPTGVCEYTYPIPCQPLAARSR